MVTPKSGDLVVGQDYLTVICETCTKVIPFAPAGNIYFSGPGKIRIGCPFCGASHEHDPRQAKVRKLEELPPTAH